MCTVADLVGSGVRFTDRLHRSVVFSASAVPGPLLDPSSDRPDAAVDPSDRVLPNSNPGGLTHEAYVPAQQPTPLSEAWLPLADADSRRTGHREEPAAPWPGQTFGLSVVSPVVADRLCDGRAISAALRGRRKRAGELLVIHVRSRDDADPARIAVVASRRVGGAVQRNRAKRLLREAARTLDWHAGNDVVLVARATCARSGLAEVHRSLTDAVDALGVADEPRVGLPS